MKKTLTVLMIVLLAAMLFVSCDNNSSEPKKEDSPTTSTYTVTFDVNGGTGTVADKTTGTDGKVSEPETAPKRTNAVFLYWSKDKSTEFNFDTALTEDTTLYAVWKTEFEVGDTGPAGGKIFYVADTKQSSDYVDSTGSTQTYTWKYLEAAPSDITITEEGETTEAFIFGYDIELDSSTGAFNPVCDVSENSNGINGDNAAIGQGRNNTTKLVNMMVPAYKKYINYSSDDIVEHFAAKLCSTYEGGGYSDWFLPSLNELYALYSAYAAGKIGGTWHTVYSSSLTASNIE